MAASFVGPGDFAFGAAVTAAGFAGATVGSGSEPRRPTLRDSLLRKPSDEPALALALELVDAGALRGAATGAEADIGSLVADVKLNDGAGSGAFGMVACEGTVPGAGR